MENTIENKALFIASHWGQKILKLSDYFPAYKVGEQYMTSYNIDRSHLELKILSSISEEDAVAGMKIMGWNDMLTDVGNANAFKRWLIEQYSIGNCFDKCINIADFLRSKGYLLPYNGLTPEQILSYGWARLTLTENVIKNAGLI